MTLILTGMAVIAADMPSSASPGWTTVSLLGAMMYWLLFHHLPGKDKQLLSLISEFRAEATAEREARERDRKLHSEIVGSITAAFKSEMAAERDECARLLDRMVNRRTSRTDSNKAST